MTTWAGQVTYKTSDMSASRRNRTESWLTVIAVAVGVPIVAVIAFVAVVFNVKPLHPSPDAVPSMMESAPMPRWAGAVDRARQLVRARVTEQNLPGVSVAVGAAGDIVWSEGFGWASLEERVAVTPRTRFRIGHVSKALTSVAAGRLQEKGLLDLDEEIQTYVPAFPRKALPVTLRQLMGHMAGVRHYRDRDWGDKPSVHCERASEGLRAFADDPLRFEPGTEYRYSTYGWVLVSAAIEAAAKKPFFAFMRTEIFDPLGMTDTLPDSVKEHIPDRATPYYRYLERERISDADYSCFAGAAAFLSTPSDLVRFGIVLNSGRFLQPATVSMLQTHQLLTSAETTDYGLGWMLETVELAGERTPLAGHASRTLEGASTSFLIFRERGLVVAVTANRSSGDMKSIALGVAELFAKEASKL